MAVLPWGHSRNQTTSNTEKSKSSSLDWFSRTTAEPSRQAISHLMKQHSRGGSGGSINVRSRSRASTPTPQPVKKTKATSDDSKKPGSITSKTSDNTTPTQSRPSTPVRPGTASLERSDSKSKSLFQKGVLLRRKGSVLSMTSPSSPVNGVTSSGRNTPSRAGLRGKDDLASPSKDEVRRPSISNPYDFAHVLHGDINAFTGLGRIDESDLASQFDAIQARYRETAELGEPLPPTPENLAPVVTPDPVTPSRSSLPIPPTADSNRSPPLPPPKNSPPPPPVASKAADVRPSRSTENFSRPTSRLPNMNSVVSPIRPSSCHLQNVTPLGPAIEFSEPIHTKPLPRIPTVVHAVSTEDDTARLLMSAPLPSPPARLDRGSSRHTRQSSSKGSLRHMSTFPSSRNPQAGTLMQEGQLLRIKEEEGPPRPHSDYELNHHVRRHSEDGRCPNKKQLQVEEWEVAIDSAWDLVEDEAELDIHQNPRRASMQSNTDGSLLTIEQSQSEIASTPTTPLMTMTPAKHSRPYPRQEGSFSYTETAEETSRNKRNSSALVGLGIGGEASSVVPSQASRLPKLEVITNDFSRSGTSPRLARSAYSAISHSSSQESIILSIASSILSTQRSSISSVSISDYPHSGKSDRLSVSNTSGSPPLNMHAQKPARPESGCLPSSLLPQMKQESRKAARPDSTCLPSVPSSRRSSAVLKSDRPRSVCVTQDLLATFPVPENKQGRGENASVNPSEVENEQDGDKVADLPTDDRHKRATGFRNSTSRMSTVQYTDGMPTTRQRSSVHSPRVRSARVSYSLFPGSAPSQTLSNVEIDGVAS